MTLYTYHWGQVRLPISICGSVLRISVLADISVTRPIDNQRVPRFGCPCLGFQEFCGYPAPKELPTLPLMNDSTFVACVRSFCDNFGAHAGSRVFNFRQQLDVQRVLAEMLPEEAKEGG